MSGWRKSPETLVALIGVALFISLLPGLSGCSLNDGSIGRVVDTLQYGTSYPLSAEAESEVARFDAVVDDYTQLNNKSQLKHFRDVYRRIRHNYVHPVDDGLLINAAIEGVTEFKFEGVPGSLTPHEVVEVGLDNMMAALDPHSSYMNADEFNESMISTSGQFGGLGIEITLEDEIIKVVSPITDTPAERAGILPGDLITHVNGEDIRNKGLHYAVSLMRGEPGSNVLITIQRDNLAPFDVSIERAIIKVRSVRWHMEGDIGYVRVTRFSERVEMGIVKAMNDIHAKSGNKLSGIVLDLRNNPGGLLDQSIILADAFLERGTIVSIKGRTTSDYREYSASPGDMASGLPMVVLINGGSASASEIVAGALQDHGRATIMGRRSFGKGSVQTITPLPIEGALRLTTSLYYAPSGQVIQARGILPDISLRLEDIPDAVDITREADLPHSLDGAQSSIHNNAPLVESKTCNAELQATEIKTDEIDTELACALLFLRSGSQSTFLYSVSIIPQS